MNNRTKVEAHREHLERSLKVPDDATKLIMLFEELNVTNFDDAMFVVDVLKNDSVVLRQRLSEYRAERLRRKQRG
jgi:hypothetical protein